MGESISDASSDGDKMEERSPSSPVLEVSVSFGRFENDSLSWEKWSSFSPNKYLEEVGKCATPGSVAKKKAYFEAHYRKIAARKAELMEQQKEMEGKLVMDDDRNCSDLSEYGDRIRNGNGDGIRNGDGDGSGIRDGIGNRNGDGIRNRNGDGIGNGDGIRNGDRIGNRNGDGIGNRNGDGNGIRNRNGDGFGIGIGIGDGIGNRNRNGDGNGDGIRDGFGIGNRNGDGDVNGNGVGVDSEISVSYGLCFNEEDDKLVEDLTTEVNDEEESKSEKTQEDILEKLKSSENRIFSIEEVLKKNDGSSSCSRTLNESESENILETIRSSENRILSIEEVKLKNDGSSSCSLTLNEPESLFVKNEEETSSEVTRGIVLQTSKINKVNKKITTRSNTLLSKETDLSRIKKKKNVGSVAKPPEVSTPKVTKIVSSSTKMHVSVSSTKKESTSTLLRTKNDGSVGGSKKTVAKSLHMSRSVDVSTKNPTTARSPATPAMARSPATPATARSPATQATARSPAIPATARSPATPATARSPAIPATARSPAIPATARNPTGPATARKSLIMESMGDKDIVKRAFRTFRNSYNNQSRDSVDEVERSTTPKQIPTKSMSSRITSPNPRKENEGSIKAGGSEKRNIKTPPSTLGLKTDEKVDKRKELSKNLQKSNTREAEKTGFPTKSKQQERTTQVKKLSQSQTHSSLLSRVKIHQ